jgi:hypothetical protein
MIVQKVLRSLSTRFDPKISSLEEREDIGTLSMDEPHGIFTTYEMRTKQENPIMKETNFKASKKTKKKNRQKLKPGCNCSDDLDEDEEKDNFVRKLKKGTNKYKGMLPLKCFDYGGIVHFVSKCPHKNKYIDEKEAYKREKKYRKGNKRRNKGNLSRKVSI